MSSPAERKALNEGVFRNANEQLERTARELIGAEDGGLVPFLCECPEMGCTQTVLLSLGEYEAVRGGPRQGLSALGHEDLSVERVLGQNDRYVLTEKFGRAGAVHEEGDPRG